MSLMVVKNIGSVVYPKYSLVVIFKTLNSKNVLTSI
jgi:hypothetical protein